MKIPACYKWNNLRAVPVANFLKYSRHCKKIPDNVLTHIGQGALDQFVRLHYSKLVQYRYADNDLEAFTASQSSTLRTILY
jgi:hypothetical protein